MLVTPARSMSSLVIKSTALDVSDNFSGRREADVISISICTSSGSFFSSEIDWEESAEGDSAAGSGVLGGP
jgi:hypothetical protein